MSSEQGNRNAGAVSLDEKTLKKFEDIKGVEVVTPIVESDFFLQTGKVGTFMMLRGIDMSKFESLGYVIEQGRNIEEQDKYGTVFGSFIGQDFRDWSKRDPWKYPPTEVNLLEDKLKLYLSQEFDNKGRRMGKSVDITGVGILKQGGDDYYAYMDIEEVKKLIDLKNKEAKKQNQSSGGSNSSSNNNKGYDSALVKCKTMDDVTSTQEVIREMGFDAWSNGEWLSSMKATSQGIQSFLGIIGSISFFVAMFGIINTMLMSVYERTREIGIMKVIGATLKDIKRLFLVEAAVIGFIGGIFGVSLSYLVSYILNNASGLEFLQSFTYGYGENTSYSIIPIWLAISGLCFSTFIGVVSGYYPARKAMKLSALSAIRTE